MNIEQFRACCLSVKGAEESISLQDRNVLVYKVMGKVFVYLPLKPTGGDGPAGGVVGASTETDGAFRAYLKCDPERSVELRERYDGINPDTFKTLMWNWITLESDVPDELIAELVRHSADEVIKKLPKYKQEEYRRL